MASLSFQTLSARLPAVGESEPLVWSVIYGSPINNPFYIIAAPTSFIPLHHRRLHYAVNKCLFPFSFSSTSAAVRAGGPQFRNVRKGSSHAATAVSAESVGVLLMSIGFFVHARGGGGGCFEYVCHY